MLRNQTYNCRSTSCFCKRVSLNHRLHHFDRSPLNFFAVSLTCHTASCPRDVRTNWCSSWRAVPAHNAQCWSSSMQSNLLPTNNEIPGWEEWKRAWSMWTCKLCERNQNSFKFHRWYWKFSCQLTFFETATLGRSPSHSCRLLRRWSSRRGAF